MLPNYLSTHHGSTDLLQFFIYVELSWRRRKIYLHLDHFFFRIQIWLKKCYAAINWSSAIWGTFIIFPMLAPHGRQQTCVQCFGAHMWYGTIKFKTLESTIVETFFCNYTPHNLRECYTYIHICTIHRISNKNDFSKHDATIRLSFLEMHYHLYNCKDPILIISRPADQYSSKANRLGRSILH